MSRGVAKCLCHGWATRMPDSRLGTCAAHACMPFIEWTQGPASHAACRPLACPSWRVAVVLSFPACAGTSMQRLCNSAAWTHSKTSTAPACLLHASYMPMFATPMHCKACVLARMRACASEITTSACQQPSCACVVVVLATFGVRMRGAARKGV